MSPRPPETPDTGKTDYVPLMGWWRRRRRPRIAKIEVLHVRDGDLVVVTVGQTDISMEQVGSIATYVRDKFHSVEADVEVLILPAGAVLSVARYAPQMCLINRPASDADWYQLREKLRREYSDQ